MLKILILFTLIAYYSTQNKCFCSQIKEINKCSVRELCNWEWIIGNDWRCNDYKCNMRSEYNCESFEGLWRCAWNQETQQCEDFINCSDIGSSKQCFDLDCSWNYFTKQCTDLSLALTCDKYPAELCLEAYAYEKSGSLANCVQNGLKGDICVPYPGCSELTYEQTCIELEYCTYENGICRHTKCEDFTQENCLPINKETNQMCLPVDGKCTEYFCQHFLSADQCRKYILKNRGLIHFNCIWNSIQKSCQLMQCSLANSEADCLFYTDDYGKTECVWQPSGICTRCSFAMKIQLFFSIIIFSI